MDGLEVAAQHRHLHAGGRVEIYPVAEGVAAEGFLHAGVEDLEHHVFLGELDLALGGRDIHVHLGRIDLQPDEPRGLNVGRDEAFVALEHGFAEVPAAEVTAVHEEVLVSHGFAGALRAGQETVHAHGGGGGLEVHDVLRHGTAQQVQDPELQGLGGTEYIQIAVVAAKRERDLGARERHAGELLDYVFELHIVAL